MGCVLEKHKFGISTVMNCLDERFEGLLRFSKLYFISVAFQEFDAFCSLTSMVLLYLCGFLNSFIFSFCFGGT